MISDDQSSCLICLCISLAFLTVFGVSSGVTGLNTHKESRHASIMDDRFGSGADGVVGRGVSEQAARRKPGVVERKPRAAGTAFRHAGPPAAGAGSQSACDDS